MRVVVQVIVQLGNDILKNLGVEEPINEVAVFFSDEFYIQFFQAAFPEIDFSQLTAGQDEREMAENIQALIDFLGEHVLKYDLTHIKGEEIVNGNPEHCINLLQLVQEIAVMIQNKAPPKEEEERFLEEEEPAKEEEPEVHGADDEMDEDDLKMYEQFLAANKQEEEEEAPIDLDDIDYEQLDPQILEIAEQMGVHPREVLQQLMQMNEEPEEEEEEEENAAEKEERLRQEKAAFKQQMLAKPAKVAPEPESEEEEESYYSEGEIQTRIKLIGQKAYSAPYIVFSDCFEEPLGGDDSESDRPPSKALSESVLQQLEMQQPPQFLQKKQENSPRPDDEEELDVDISQRLLELQNKQASAAKPAEEPEEEEEDEEMLIDLDQLDDQNRQMLLEYLHQEYEKNPDQFPFPKELIEEYMLKQQPETVKDINSQEMVLEDAQPITGGGQQIEDEIQEDDDEAAEYLEERQQQEQQIEEEPVPQ